MLARRWPAAAVLLALTTALAGCSGGNSGVYSQVSGKVTHNGNPVDGAKVTFFATAGASGSSTEGYSALTDSSGKYLIATINKEPGIPPGLYKVTITKLEASAKGGLPKDFDQGQMEASGMAKNLMPKDYESLATTKLSVTLEPGKNENKDFDLKGTASNSKAGTGGAGTP